MGEIDMYMSLRQARHIVEKMRADGLTEGASQSLTRLADMKELSDDCTVEVHDITGEAAIVKYDTGEGVKGGA
jgi:hypothetical protein